MDLVDKFNKISAVDHFEARVINAVYAACVGIYEDLEHKNMIHGNGHHMAQKIAMEAGKLLKERWVDKK